VRVDDEQDIYLVAWALLSDSNRAIVCSYPQVPVDASTMDVLAPFALAFETTGTLGGLVRFLDAGFVNWLILNADTIA
jgi:hypothetical protein